METKTTKAKQYQDKLSKNKRGYKFLKFPLDVDTDATQNIMLININAISGSKYEGVQYRTVQGETSKVSQSGSNSLYRHFSGNTKRIDTAIALHMPPTVQSSYSADWGTSQFGLTGSAIDAWKSMGDITDQNNWKNMWNGGKNTALELLKLTGVKVADTLLPTKIKDPYMWANQIVENPYVEVIFNGISNRTFSFTFKFIPKSKKEQESIKQIVDTLKFHRAPERKENLKNLYWAFPSTFDISFLKKNGQENEWLFKISTCALTELNVQQGSETHFGNFPDGSPFSTHITMNFTELEVLDKNRILQGF
jgi:hypothetical protein